MQRYQLVEETLDAEHPMWPGYRAFRVYDRCLNMANMAFHVKKEVCQAIVDRKNLEPVLICLEELKEQCKEKRTLRLKDKITANFNRKFGIKQ